MKNVRRHLIINPRFQFRLSMFIMFVILAVSSGFPFVLLQMFETAGNHALIMNNPPAQLALEDVRREFLFLIISVNSVLVVASFITSIILSHRIAGPMYKLRTAMTNLRLGVLDRHIYFRDKDSFPELAEEFNAMSDAIYSRRKKDLDYVQSVLPKLERLRMNLQGEQQAIVAEVLQSLQELSREHPSANK
jgi:methyl-accepting chemotaxis protein